MRKLIALGAAALGGTAVVASKRTSVLRERAATIGTSAKGYSTGARERLSGVRASRSKRPLLLELGQLTYDKHSGALNGEADSRIAEVISDLETIITEEAEADTANDDGVLTEV